MGFSRVVELASLVEAPTSKPTRWQIGFNRWRWRRTGAEVEVVAASSTSREVGMGMGKGKGTTKRRSTGVPLGG